MTLCGELADIKCCHSSRTVTFTLLVSDPGQFMCAAQVKPEIGYEADPCEVACLRDNACKLAATTKKGEI